jgi:asparagine synthase (glutamine-hydrolysing)
VLGVLPIQAMLPEPDIGRIRELVVASVTKRMMADVPFGTLLSGGLDSSIVSAIVARLLPEPSLLHTFAVGLANCSDILAARKVAAMIGSTHHEIVITVSDVLGCIRDAIWHVESFDVATIRSAIPMMLMAREISKLGFRMVMGGDGADELFAGYAYFKYAPGADELHAECVRKVLTLSRYDCKRGNHAMMAGSVEYRCPYLDKALVRYVMTEIAAKSKMHLGTDGSKKIEKYILRKAFEGWLPSEIIWREKVQFSAGCGDDLIGSLIRHAGEVVTDDEFALRGLKYSVMTPLTKEAYMYRQIFCELFGETFTGIVTYVPSLNCSTLEAREWFPESVRNCLDPCGVSFAAIAAKK